MKKRYILLGSVVFYLLFLRTRREDKKNISVAPLSDVTTTIRDFLGDVASKKAEVKSEKAEGGNEKAKEPSKNENSGISTITGSVGRITTGVVENATGGTPPAKKPKSPLTTENVISKEDALINAITDLKKAVEGKNENEQREKPAVPNVYLENENISPGRPSAGNEIIGNEPIRVEPSAPDEDLSSDTPPANEGNDDAIRREPIVPLPVEPDPIPEVEDETPDPTFYDNYKQITHSED